MKNLKLAAIFAVSVLAIAAIAAGIVFIGDTEGNIKDARGRSVSVPDDVDKVVCLSAGSVRIVSYFGNEAVSKIVGIDSMDANKKGSSEKYYMATYRLAYDIENLNNVGSEESIKAIVATGADVIISSKESVADLDSLQDKTGIPVVGIAAEGNICAGDKIFVDNIFIVGKILGMEIRAKQICQGVDKLVSQLKSMKLAQSVECYVGGMFYMMNGGFYKTTGLYPSFDLIGAKNIMPNMNNGNPYDILNKDLALHSDTKYIFVDSLTLNESKDSFLADKEILKNVDAVKNGKMYSTFVYKYYGTNWEAELINAYAIGNLISPDKFQNPVDFAKKVLNVFYPDSNPEELYDKMTDFQNGVVRLGW